MHKILRASDMATLREHNRAVCVYLSSSQLIAARYHELAAEVGRALCERNMSLVSGGGGISTMGVLARTVRANGGHTTGVIPEQLMALEVGDMNADELFVTRDMRERKALMDAHSDAFLALPGGLGTLEELLEVWVGRTLGMHLKPVVVLDPWGDFAELLDLVKGLQQRKMVRADAAADALWTTSVDEALDAIERAWQRGEGRGGTPQTLTVHPDEWLEAD